MPDYTDLTGLTGVASVLAASLLMLPGIARLDKLRRAILLAAVFAATLIPIGDLPIAAYARGMTGDLSISTLVLVWSALLTPWFAGANIGARSHMALLMLVAVTALFFYPMALGAGAYDPYRLGYGSPYFVTALLSIALAAWLLGYPAIASCIALATLAWAIGWYESGNLWDYLLDPFVAIYALCAVAIRAIAWRTGRPHGAS